MPGTLKISVMKSLSPLTPCSSYRTVLSPSGAVPLPPTEIIPRLYLADLGAAESPNTLLALGITHILSAMSGTVALPPNVHVQRLQLPLQDSPFAELAAHLPSSTAFIRDALRDPNARVLVHCVQGISRSSSVVCAYLMALYGWTAEQAVQYVKSKRSRVEPNPGFVSQLGEYQATLRR